MEELVLEAGRSERQYWRDLWRFRELFIFLAWRDLLVRYRQTIVGASWSVVRPLLTMVVLTVVFGKLAKMPAEGAPYPLLVLCGMLPWQFVSTALSEAGNSLVANAGLVTKVYFPRMVLPASTLVTGVVDLFIAVGLMAAVMVWYRFVPGLGVFLLPVFILMAFAAALGAGLWISSLMAKYRDFRFIVPFVVQLGLYISPVGFSSDVVPANWRLLYSINPMVGVIDGFRWAILGGVHELYWPGLLLSSIAISLLLLSGLRYFRATERTFADVI
jgi:lipopolysaccharide transport system permease protein